MAASNYRSWSYESSPVNKITLQPHILCEQNYTEQFKLHASRSKILVNFSVFTQMACTLDWTLKVFQFWWAETVPRIHFFLLDGRRHSSISLINLRLLVFSSQRHKQIEFCMPRYTHLEQIPFYLMIKQLEVGQVVGQISYIWIVHG